MCGGGDDRGTSLVELVVAMALLSVIALALTTTIVACQQARLVSERWMRASLLAAEGVEQLRAGQALTEVVRPTIFTRSGGVQDAAGRPSLQHIEVTVSWNDGEQRAIRLSTLAYRPAAAP